MNSWNIQTLKMLVEKLDSNAITAKEAKEYAIKNGVPAIKSRNRAGVAKEILTAIREHKKAGGGT